jgi:ferredoxin
MRRNVIKIDEEKCTGCGQCVPNCPEGALQIIDGKARLVSDLFCDGLGACIGECPEGAIEIEKREAEPYNERKVMENIIKGGKNVIKAHLEHLKGHGQTKLLNEAKKFLKEKGIPVPEESQDHGHEHGHHHGGTCPGSKVVVLEETEECCEAGPKTKAVSRLRQWPVQLHLVPENAPYFKDADLLVAADCVPFAYAGFHEELLKGKVLLVGCPKLDDADAYLEKLTNIFSQNDIKSVTCAHMEVPCCFGLVRILKEAVSRSGKKIPLNEVNVSIRGEIL